MTFDWGAGLPFFVTIGATTALGRCLAFKVPALRKVREKDLAADAPKTERPSYRESIRANAKISNI